MFVSAIPFLLKSVFVFDAFQLVGSVVVPFSSEPPEVFPELPSSGFAGVLVDVFPPPVEPPLPPLPGLDGPSSPQAVSIETAIAAASRQTAAFLKSLIVDTSIVCSEYPRMCSIYHIIPPPPMYVSTTKFKFVIFTKTMSNFVAKSQKSSPANTAEELSLNYSSPVFSLASTSFRLVHSMVYRPRISSSAGSRSGTITVTNPPAAPARTPL